MNAPTQTTFSRLRGGVLRTSLAVKIFLSFWLIHALIFVVLAVVPDPGENGWRVERARRGGELAVAMFERDPLSACRELLPAIEGRMGSRLELFDPNLRPLCGTSNPSASDAHLLRDASAAGLLRKGDNRETVAVALRGPSGMTYKVLSARKENIDPEDRPPVPYQFLATAIIVSGLVCLLLARYLVSPLLRMRQATHRLREGDLTARVGAGVGRRADEIGDVVRDFDAMADRVESLVSAQQQLLSDISHELRSPLARLNVALELARRSSTGAEAHLERIAGEAERMNELIGRLLALSRAESRGDRGASEEFDLEEVVRRVASDAQYEAHRSSKRVELEVNGKATLVGDPVLVASAVENVVRNAVRYTPAGLGVRIRCDVDDREARVVVCDEGGGLPESELERIFLPFHRVDPSRNRESGGAGLGLSIARRAVASQGGTIRADNADGGLQVTITLPLTNR